MKFQVGLLNKKGSHYIYKYHTYGADYNNGVFNFIINRKKSPVQPEKQNKQKGERRRVEAHIRGEVAS